MKVLWLCSWYPNKLNPLNGDFVQRHAIAASRFHHIDVIHLCRDENGTITKTSATDHHSNGSLTETILYYHSFTTGIKSIDRFFSSLKYRELFKKRISKYIAENGLPDIVHVHVTMNAGLLALWMKKKFGIHYFVTEHASFLLPEAEHNFSGRPLLYRTLWKRIIEQASGLSVVSRYLGEMIATNILNKSYRVIPNVVNTGLFKPVSKHATEQIHFIHISRMDYQKNPEAIFKAFSIVKETYPSFQVDIFSNENQLVKKLVYQYDLQNYVILHSEVEQSELVPFIQQADALVLFSRYETFGCVVAEANACGVPVIVSDIPTMHELVEEKINGIFAVNDSAEDLARKILWFIENKNSFSNKQIAETAAAKYNYEEIGRQFSDWYLQVTAR